MGYWKKPGKYTCKKECRPYINLFGGSTTTAGGVVVFTECGPLCGFDQCLNDVIVQHDGVYAINYFLGTGATPALLINNVAPPVGQTLFCLKCGDKIRLSSTGATTGVSLTIFKVS